MTKNTCLPRGKKSKPLALLGATLLMGTMSYAQSINFNYTDGTNTAYNLEDVRKITFDADVMKLQLWDGSLYEWNVSTIVYYQYDETPLNTKEWLNQANVWQVKVFPNPTSTTLNVRFQLPQEDQISISLNDLQGKLLLRKSVGIKAAGEHLESIDLSGLPQGTYLCRISGQQTTITKQVIKQ